MSPNLTKSNVLSIFLFIVVAYLLVVIQRLQNQTREIEKQFNELQTKNEEAKVLLYDTTESWKKCMNERLSCNDSYYKLYAEQTQIAHLLSNINNQYDLMQRENDLLKKALSDTQNELDNFVKEAHSTTTINMCLLIANRNLDSPRSPPDYAVKLTDLSTRGYTSSYKSHLIKIDEIKYYYDNKVDYVSLDIKRPNGVVITPKLEYDLDALVDDLIFMFNGVRCNNGVIEPQIYVWNQYQQYT